MAEGAENGSLGPGEVTRWLQARGAEAPGALTADLVPVLYRELRRIAASRLSKERPGLTLTPTALVHEAYLELSRQRVQWKNRAHFLGVASIAMRRVLVHAAEARRAAKRGSGVAPESLEETEVAAGLEFDPEAVISLDRHLSALAVKHDRAAQVVEWKVFGGMSFEEIADLTDLSVPTLRRDWKLARAFMAERMATEESIERGS